MSPKRILALVCTTHEIANDLAERWNNQTVQFTYKSGTGKTEFTSSLEVRLMRSNTKFGQALSGFYDILVKKYHHMEVQCLGTIGKVVFKDAGVENTIYEIEKDSLDEVAKTYTGRIVPGYVPFRIMQEAESFARDSYAKRR